MCTFYIFSVKYVILFKWTWAGRIFSVNNNVNSVLIYYLKILNLTTFMILFGAFLFIFSCSVFLFSTPHFPIFFAVYFCCIENRSLDIFAIYFCVLLGKETHTGLKRHLIIINNNTIFGWTVPLKSMAAKTSIHPS